MAPLIKKLSYQNSDKWIEKFSDIQWDIPNDKYINHKFQLQSGIGEIAEQNFLIHLNNVIGCFKFLISHPGF